MTATPVIRALLVMLTLALPMAQGQAADMQLADPALESRARALMKEVRCVVCQSQSIDESDAGIAVDLRRLIREDIAAGKSDDEIRQFLVDRYGDFILFTPPFKAETLILWLGPFVMLLGGLAYIIWFLRRRQAALPPGGLSAEEQQRVRAALDQGENS